MFWSVLAALAVLVVVIVVLTSSKADPKRDERPDLERRIDEMERAAASLEASLAEIDNETAMEDRRDEGIALNYAGPQLGPDFEFGDAAVPLVIRYNDGAGQVTEREITVLRYTYGPTGGVLSAYCHYRGAKRTFYFTRIVSAVCAETGEHIQHLGPWLDAAYLSTAPGKAGSVLEKHADALDALFYVAKADGAFRAKEKASVIAFLRAVSHEVAIDTEIGDRIIAQLSRCATPSAIAYGKALSRLQAHTPAYRGQLLKAAKEMVASDKTVVHAENNALKRMAGAFGGNETTGC